MGDPALLIPLHPHPRVPGVPRPATPGGVVEATQGLVHTAPESAPLPEPGPGSTSACQQHHSDRLVSRMRAEGSSRMAAEIGPGIWGSGGRVGEEQGRGGSVLKR